VANVPDLDFQPPGMTLHQPPEVPLHAGPREVVEDDHPLPRPKKRIGKVAADEPRAPRDHHRSISSHAHALLRSLGVAAAPPVPGPMARLRGPSDHSARVAVPPVT